MSKRTVNQIGCDGLVLPNPVYPTGHYQMVIVRGRDTVGFSSENNMQVTIRVNIEINPESLCL